MAIEGDITMRKTQYVKELNDVRNQTNAATKEMENGFKRYGTSINKAGIAMRYVSAEMGAGAVAFGRAFQVLAGGKIAVAVAAITGAFVGLKKIWDEITLSADEYNAKLLSQVELNDKDIESMRKSQTEEDAMLERLKELSKRQDKTIEEKNEAARIAEILTGKYGKLGISINDLTEDYNTLLEAQKKVNDIVLSCTFFKGEEKRLRAELTEAETRRGKLAADLAALGEQYKAEKARAFDFTAETTCPYCGQEMPAATIEQAAAKARDAFLKRQKEVVDGILATAKSVKNDIGEEDKTIAALREKITEEAGKYYHADIEASKWKGERDRLVQQPEADLAAIEAEARGSEEFKVLVAQERDLRAKALKTSCRPDDAADLVNKRKEIDERISAVTERFAKEELAAQEALSIGKVRADQLELIRQKENQAKNFADALARDERDEARAAAFVKADIDSVEKAINGLFHTARWKMFDQTIDGKIVEMCEVMSPDGVPYRSMNDAMKILCGLDCIRVFSEHYGSLAPIFIDNAEGILRDTFDTPAQVIRLVVKDTDNLTLIPE